MNDYLATIQFENYIVPETILKQGEFNTEETEFAPEFALFKDDDIGTVEIGFKITRNNFQLSGKVVGFFSYDKTLSEPEVQQLLISNGLAILFPYVRSTITNITSAVNLEPIFIPTINIFKYLDEKMSGEEQQQIEE